MKYCVSFFISMVLCLISCEHQDRQVLPSSKGLPSEVLLVVDEQIWNSDLADSLTAITQCALPCVMQYEPYFRLTRISSKYYSQRYRTFHTKMFVHLDPTVKKTELLLGHNVSAKPQVEMTITAPDLPSLRKFMSEKSSYIRTVLNDSQIEMRANDLSKHFSQKVNKEVMSHLGLSIHVPASIIASKKRKDFYWAGSNLQEKDLNIVIYRYELNGENVFSDSMFVTKRDSVMKINIPGSNDDQWMQTTRLDGRPVIEGRKRVIGGREAYEVFGMWEMRNGALGGPFISITRVDTATATVTVGEGFVYSPSTEKRELLRQLEAALLTLK